MPSQKTRSKEDTWTPDELNRALKTGERRHHRDRDDDRKREKVIGDDKHRRRKDDDSDRHRTRDDEDRRRRRKEEDENGSTRLTEDDRERQRRERRERREKDAHPKKGELTFRNKSEGKHIDLQEMEDSPDERHRRHKDDRERRSKDGKGHRDRDDDRDKRHRDREDRHGDDKRERRRRDEEDRHGDDKRERRRREEEDAEVDRERRRIERRKERETKEEAERRRRHEEKKERRRLEEENERRRDKDDRSDKHRDRREKDRDRDHDERRKEKEREERRREREERHKDKESKSRRDEEKKQEEKKEEEEEDEYNYEEDFEDYEEDFEEDDDDDDDDAKENNVKGSIHREKKHGTELDYSDSEVNAVLKALDAENDRLIRESSKSPKFSSNQRDDSDDDSDDKYEKSYQPRARPRTAINFVSAKQRAMNSKTASKTKQRGSDLLKMLELDYISFDILDMPPVNEYDLYIRAFGGTNTRQAYVQTNDDNVDRDLQTEEIDARQKWTQHPAEDFAGCGRGDGEKDFDEEEESQAKQNKEQDTSRLNTFLEKAGQMIAILLEEGKDDEGEQLGKRQSHIAISEGYTELDLLPILAGRHVVSSHFSPVQPNLLLTVYSQAAEVSADNPVSKRGIICVWNTSEPNYPQNPVKPSLVFAGMQDGSIAMWDLREASSLHCPTVINDQSYSLRYPTYDTAAVLSEENHHSPVTCINPIYSYINSSKSGSTSGSQSSSAPEESTSGLSFQLVSTEETGTLHFWVVAELSTLDMSGSINDLGLAPGGKVKLIKSSALSPESSNNQSEDIDSRLKVGGMKALDMKLLPADPNQYYIATDSGCVLHGVRFGKRAYPRAHSPVIECIVDVLSIDFSPFEKPCFLAGCSDGSFSIYHTKSANPLITWPTVTKGNAVLFVRWSRSRPCVFYILDSASTLYVFDLLEGDTGPKMTEQVSKDRVSNLSMTNDYKASGLGTPGKKPQILFGLENGKTEIHTVTKTLREPEDLEADFLTSYLQRF